MGEYYREAPVYILKKGRLDIEPYQGINYEKIDEFMDKYFEFLNNPIGGDILMSILKVKYYTIILFIFILILMLMDELVEQ